MAMDILQKLRTTNILSPDLNKEKGMFLRRLGGLLEEGYSIKQSLKFIEKFEKEPVKTWITQLQKGLMQGQQLHEELEKIGYSSKICSQIYLASQAGNYGEIVKRCGEDMLEQEQFKKKLRSLLAYPCVLFVFLLVMLVLMRFLILPNMENMFADNLSETNIYADFLVSFIYYSPQIILLSLGGLIASYWFINRKLTDYSPLERIQFFIKKPFISQYLKNYWTNFIFLEWGQLLRNGVSFQEIIVLMAEEDASAMLKETGEILKNEMIQGKSVKESLRALPFIEEEALAVISHGENLGHLGTELLIYASYCEVELTDRLEKLLGKLQPIVFVFIALMIIAIYASMILPIYTLMEGI